MTTTGYQQADKFVELSERDKQRTACLYKEVQGRLKEMSLIMARTLRMEVSERTTVMLRPLSVNTASPSPGRESFRQGQVEVHCTQTSEGHWECGCYDYDAGTCGPC
jgi:hypothetical protein